MSFESILDLVMYAAQGIVNVLPSGAEPIVLILGSLWLIITPLVALAQAVVKIIPGDKDNQLLEKILDSKAYEIVSAILEALGGLKAPKSKKKK